VIEISDNSSSSSSLSSLPSEPIHVEAKGKYKIHSNSSSLPKEKPKTPDLNINIHELRDKLFQAVNNTQGNGHRIQVEDRQKIKNVFLEYSAPIAAA
jgi:hypothetical protein